MSRIGFYGGSFNPPHVGHQATVLYALETADIDRVIVAPVFVHPYGKKLVNFNDRTTMCWKMISRFQDVVSVSRIEEEAHLLGSNGLTSETIKLLRGDKPRSSATRVDKHDTIVLIMGSDLKDDIKTWAGYDYLQAQCEEGLMEFFFVERVGSISSTKVREAIKENKPYRRLVPQGVFDYIQRYRLYEET